MKYIYNQFSFWLSAAGFYVLAVSHMPREIAVFMPLPLFLMATFFGIKSFIEKD